MPVNPNIALQATVPQAPDMMRSLSDMMTLKNQQQQGQVQATQLQANQMALQEAQRQKEEQDLIRSIYENPGTDSSPEKMGDIDEYLAALEGRISPQAFIGVETEFNQQRESQLRLSDAEFENTQNENTMFRSIIGGVTDDLTKNQAVRELFNAGHIDENEANHYLNTPYAELEKEIEGLKIRGLTREQINNYRASEAQLTAAENQLQYQKEDRPLQQRVLEADVQLKEREVTGSINLQGYMDMVDAIVVPGSERAADPEISRAVTATKDAITRFMGAGDWKAAEKERQDLKALVQNQDTKEFSKSLQGEIPPQTQERYNRLADAIASGSLVNPYRLMSIRSERREIFLDTLLQRHPDFDVSSIQRKINILDLYTSGKGGDQLQAYNTFLMHAAAAHDLYKMIENTDSALLNKSVNWLRLNVGKYPELRRVLTAITPAKDEFYAFLLNNRAMHETDRQEGLKIINEDLPISDALVVLEQMAETANARAYNANNRYKTTMEMDMPEHMMFSPLARDAMETLGTVPFTESGVVPERPKNPFKNLTGE